MPKPKDVRFAEPLEPRHPLVLLLDTSGSMRGKPIEELNKGLKIFEQELKEHFYIVQRVEIAVVTFGSVEGPVQTRQDFVNGDDWQAEEYTAHSLTHITQALNYALDMIGEVKDFYQSIHQSKDDPLYLYYHSYYRSCIVLITGGEPTDNWQSAAQRLKELKGEVLFFAIGVEGANMDVLKQITPNPQFNFIKLNGYEFSKTFQWLSKRLIAYLDVSFPS